MNKKTSSKGFTLIELLVVIAIIAVLSSIVIASLRSARIKASDNAIKAAMTSLRSQAEIYWVSNNNFGVNIGVCDGGGGLFDDPKIEEVETYIEANNAIGATISCQTSPDGEHYAFGVSLLHGGGTWCVDNSSWFNTGTVQANGTCQ